MKAIAFSMFCLHVLAAHCASAACTASSAFLTDNGNKTVTDSRTKLMWKQCLEGDDDCSGNPSSYNWTNALARPGIVNDAGGFAGHADWRLPNIKELQSLVEEACSAAPLVNTDRFPGTPATSYAWSSSPYVGISSNAWLVRFDTGLLGSIDAATTYHVRLVRNAE